jgi:cation diffusion facilitator CzcD-associated flavoprotein CzcO
MDVRAPQHGTTVHEPLDALVVGTGQAGIYQLYRLQEQGLTVHAVDAADGAGGVWNWNRYPGARFDSESWTYGYFFSPELYQEWDWSEHFAGQPEVERYFNAVVDRFDLRRLITFGLRVVRTDYDAATSLWTVQTDRGVTFTARFLVLALGGLSTPQFPAVPGRERFRGVQAHTGLWPKEGVDVAGKRVAVVGTGPSGVQVISSIAGEVASLTVFQRSPHWVTPLRNAPIPPDELADIKSRADRIHEICMTESFAGFIHCLNTESAAERSAQEREAFWEDLYRQRGFSKWLGNYVEVLTTRELNDEYCRFLERKIRARVPDPALADKLIPRDHGYGAKRPPFDTNYYEAYARDTVTLVDLNETPLDHVTETGLATTAQAYEFDVIVWATGFDALTGAYDRIDIHGRDGRTLADAWADGPHTVLGLLTPGFPNMFSVAGPHSTGGNVPRATEVQVDFVAGLIAHALRRGAAAVEATPAEADTWTTHVMEAAYGANAAPELDYNYGGNIPGKKVVFRSYAGGVPQYSAKCQEYVASGYGGFVFDSALEPTR